MLLGLLGLGCEFDVNVGATWAINQPRVLAVRMEVVEPAPIWTERIGLGTDQAPVAEALPGDIVRLVPLVVDGQGRAQAPETIDALWFQCGSEDCIASVPACDSIAWTTDSACEIGRGGALEFPFPALGPAGLEAGAMTVLGIIGRHPGADAERCRAGLLEGTIELQDCTLFISEVLIGPPWVLRVEAVNAGLEVELPLYEIPYLLLFQPANRAPAPAGMVLVDIDTQQPLEGSPPRVHAGQRIHASPAWRSEDSQPYAQGRLVDDGSNYAFKVHFERLGAHYFASGPINFIAVDGSGRELVVDEGARPGIIRLVVVVGDQRGEETKLPEGSVRHGAVNMLVQELEVMP
ncbi:hypothetical protein DB30_03471 [Enhygromyxa salina]|uniref:Uncharacterized protein n=1 Tax=Enhygromyxa salina TaxID=215803 RepID=A0A0C2A1P1_9BACT|nr:hypothetical protein DB30_03471 [Enhygromyxa salina]